MLLVSYASAGAEEDPGAMIVDQFSFGPRRVYVILHLVAHGDSWGVDGLSVVPYVAVSVSCVVGFGSRLIHFPHFDGIPLILDLNTLSECFFSACASTVDTPFRGSGHCSVIWRGRDFLCSRYALAPLQFAD